MRMKSCLALLVGLGLALAAAAADDDPFLWLEQVNDPRAMDWVKAENAKTSAVLEADARYATLRQAALALAQANDRIPEPSVMGGDIYNLWQDAAHQHGLWRRTGFAEFLRPDATWTPLLDLDALSAAEHANWFWQGAQCAEPGEHDCMLALTDGGEDAATEREFDVRTGQFVDGGFVLPRGKQDIAWEDEDTLLASREWTPGEMTSSGYPFVVKRLRRGQPLAAATEVFRGDPTDVGVGPAALRDGDGNTA
ncbi:MAG TPA: hypothetical protein VMT49_03725, partial [Steroidobacteraceae bacterium]|nr:hypothetical protein [Steroidobacteraceae bacterium]